MAHAKVTPRKHNSKKQFNRSSIETFIAPVQIHEELVELRYLYRLRPLGVIVGIEKHPVELREENLTHMATFLCRLSGSLSTEPIITKGTLPELNGEIAALDLVNNSKMFHV